MKPAPATWRVALIDSCADHPGALDRAAFEAGHGTVLRRRPCADPTGHGSRIAQVFAGGSPREVRPEGSLTRRFELLLGQVFVDNRPTSAAAVAAAVDWALEHQAGLVHLSLGLAADRAVLRAAIERAVAAGCVMVASTPARGPEVFPASYPGVIRGTGDARCAPGELSHLQPWLFGAHPHPDVPLEEASTCMSGTARATGTLQAAGPIRAAGGASIGAARVTRAILDEPPGCAQAVVAALIARSTHIGPERRTAERP